MNQNPNGKIWQKKSFGQVFLKDEWPCNKIVDILQQHQIDTVLEIGPGGAALTNKLLDAGIRITAVEKDERFVERLQHLKTIVDPDKKGHFEVIHSDILKFDLDSWLKSATGRIAIVGNIPYNISTPILEMILPRLSKIKISVMMVQKEFGERVAANSGIKSYGSLSVFTQLRAAVRLEFLVERYCFSPVPKVDSVVISLKQPIVKVDDILLKKTENLTREAFCQRRKKMSNAISKLIQDVDPATLGIDLNRRPETLTPNEYLELAKKIWG